MAARTRRAACNNVVEALIFGAGLTIFVVYAFLNSWRSTLITALSLPTSADRGVHRRVGVRLHAELHDAAGPVAGHRRAHRRRHRRSREHRAAHGDAAKTAITAARNGTAEIGLAVTATTFSIMAVFVPVAFMGGVAGEWFRPFALTVASSVLVSLFISFTLDPMLSAYWGDPPDQAHRKRGRLGETLKRFNVWFDHQADRYAQRDRVGAASPQVDGGDRVRAASSARSLLQATVGGSSFLPRADAGMVAIEVRTPSSASLEYARLKVEKAAELARGIPETMATNSTRERQAAAACTWTSARATSARVRRRRSARICASA